MKKLIFIIYLLAAANLSLYSQKYNSLDEILKDKNVIWVGEFSVNFPLDDINQDDYSDKFLKSVGYKCAPPDSIATQNTIYFKDVFRPNLIKYQPNYKYDSDDFIYGDCLKDKPLYEELDNAISSNSIALYKDSYLSTKLNNKQYKDIFYNKTITYDPETFEEILYLEKPKPNEILSYQLKSYIYYNIETNRFGLFTTSMSPMRNSQYRNVDSNKINNVVDTTFWIGVENKYSNSDLYKNEVSLGIMASVNYHPSLAKIIKSEKTYVECVDIMLKKIMGNSTIDTVYNGIGEILKKDTNFLTSTDTIITITYSYPYEEFFQVVTNTAELKDISNTIRFFHEYYWDVKRGKLISYPRYFGPIIYNVDENNNFLNSGPVFLKKCHR